MKAYFLLQFKLFNRNLKSIGLPPLIAYTILPIAFYLASFFLFKKVAYASYIYGVLALIPTLSLGEHKRNDLLKMVFKKSQYHLLRMLENTIYALPFILFMFLQASFLQAIVLGILAVLLAFFNFNSSSSLVIPTPFGKKPFEFVIGFRKTVLLFPFAYFLTYVAIVVNNFNLGLFALLVIMLNCLSFYNTTEEAYLVWIYKLKAKKFLGSKIKSCLLNFYLLIAPTLVALNIFFGDKIVILLILMLIFSLYLITIVLAKYAAFPKQINLIQGIIIALCFVFPPTLIFVMPYFYKKSIQQLNCVLS